VNPIREISGTVPSESNFGNTGAQNVMSYNQDTSEIFYSDVLSISTMYTQYGFSSNGTWTTSDRNVKENINAADLTLCYSTIRQLPLRRFNFISSFAQTRQDKNQLGFIAQEVGEIFPKSLIETYNTTVSSTIYQLNYDQINMAHYGTTQLLMSTVETQRLEINDLKATVSTLASSYSDLISRLPQSS
jgi:hypothetical protein